MSIIRFATETQRNRAVFQFPTMHELQPSMMSGYVERERCATVPFWNWRIHQHIPCPDMDAGHLGQVLWHQGLEVRWIISTLYMVALNDVDDKVILGNRSFKPVSPHHFDDYFVLFVGISWTLGALDAAVAGESQAAEHAHHAKEGCDDETDRHWIVFLRKRRNGFSSTHGSNRRLGLSQ